MKEKLKVARQSGRGSLRVRQEKGDGVCGKACEIKSAPANTEDKENE